MTPLRATLYTHACVVLWGFTAILGKIITLAALPLVAWRMAITAVCLLFLSRAWHKLHHVARSDWPLLALGGTLIALHWLAFYASVKLANASIGVLCITFAPVFSAIFSPLLTKSAFSLRDFLLGLSVVPGMLLVIGGVDPRFHLGIGIGVVSALLVALFVLLNKSLVQRVEALNMSFIEMSFGAVLMWAVLWIAQPESISLPSGQDVPNLLLFALLCTALPFALSNAALKYISAFTAQFAVNLEPLYGIVFAAVLLNESAQLTPQFYLGAGIILLAVFAQGWLSLRAKPESGTNDKAPVTS